MISSKSLKIITVLLLLTSLLYLGSACTSQHVTLSPAGPAFTSTVTPTSTLFSSQGITVVLNPCGNAVTVGNSYSVTLCLGICNTGANVSTPVTVTESWLNNNGGFTFSGWGFNGTYPYVSGSGPTASGSNMVFANGFAAGACVTVEQLFTNSNYPSYACQNSNVLENISWNSGANSIPSTVTLGVPCSTPSPTPTVTQTTISTNSPTQTMTDTIIQSPTKTMTATYTATNLSGLTSTSTLTPTQTNSATPTVTYTTTNPVYAVLTALATAPNLNMTSGVTTLTTGVYYFSCVHLSAGAVMTITGSVTIYSECFTLDAGATINGVGGGYLETYDSYSQTRLIGGPGAGIPDYSGQPCMWYISGGGGHGGAGGTDHDSNCVLAQGGAANDDPVHPSLMGSAGVSPDFGYSSNGPDSLNSAGGALLNLVIYNPVTNKLAPATINGTIDMSGSPGCNMCGPQMESGSGGAGGTILIEAINISGSGLLQANGGTVYLNAGAGGGGGIISLIENLSSFQGTISAAGGMGSINGTTGCTPPSSNGSTGSVTFTTGPGNGF
jgi:hypothetical protein